MDVDERDRLRGRHERVSALFAQLADATTSQRSALFEVLDRETPSIARELRELLALDSQDVDVAPVVAPSAGPAEATLGGRYELLGRLGAGGAGEVFRAIDRHTGEFVAVKRLHDVAGGDEARRRFEREARALSRLTHPGCVRHIDVGVDHGRPYLVMEFVGGGDLNRLRAATPAERLRVLSHLAVALAYVHRRGFVHRDLKPANVLLTSDTPALPKLADFGMVSASRDVSAPLTASGALMGTADYLAPEQLEGGTVGPATDLYALGCIAFWLFASRPVFEGALAERVLARCRQPAPRLDDVARDASTGLADLVASLLATRPADRPASALEVAQTLLELWNDAAHSRHLTLDWPLGASATLYKSAFVGRAVEVVALTERLRAAQVGGTPLVAVNGEAGVGKSALVRAVTRAMERAGALVLYAPPPRDGQPLSPFPELVTQLRSDVTKADGHAWEGVFDDAAAGLANRARSLADALAGLGAPVLVLDDAHLMGEGARAMLAQLVLAMSRLAPPRPAIAVSTRQRIELEHVVHWLVSPLGESAALELAANALGRHPAEVPSAALVALTAATHGNPAQIERLLGHWVATGALDGEPGGSLVFRPDRAAASPGNELAVGGPARALLETLAVHDRPVETILLEAVFAAPLPDRLPSVVECDAQGRVALPVGVAAALREAMGAERRMALHDAWWEVMNVRAGEQVGYHAERGSRPDRALVAHLDAGERAAAAGDQAEAIVHWEAAATLTGDESQKALIERRRCEALLTLGRADEARPVLERLLRVGGDRIERSRGLSMMASALLQTESPAGALALLQAALRAMGTQVGRGRVAVFARIAWDVIRTLVDTAIRSGRPGDPTLIETARLHRELAVIYRWIDLERGGAHAFAFLRAGERLGDAGMRAEAFAMVSIAFGFTGLRRVAEWCERRARRFSAQVLDPRLITRAISIRGGAGVLLRRHTPSAFEDLDLGVSLAEQTGDRHLLNFALTCRGWGSVAVGRLEQARADFRRALAVCDDIGARWLRIDARCGLAILDVVQGKVASSDELARELMSDDIRLTFPTYEALGVEISGAGYLLEHRYHEGLLHLERARELYDRHHLDRGWGFLVDSEIVEARLCVADFVAYAADPDLVSHLRGDLRWMRRRIGQLSRYEGMAEVVEGVIAARTGREARARAAFERARSLRARGESDYIDAWVGMRTAFELHRLGEPLAKTLDRLDRVYALYEAGKVWGQIAWVRELARRYGVAS